MNRPRIAVLGSVHMDLIARAPTLPDKGQSVVGYGFTMAPGGKGGNQACQCALMGAETYMLTSLGNDLFGRELLSALQFKGVNTDHVVIDTTHATGASTVLSSEQGYSSVIYPGAAAHMTITQIDTALNRLDKLDALILQLELPLALVQYAAAKAKSMGTPVILNYSPAPQALPDQLLSNVSTLVLNQNEACAIGSITNINAETLIVTAGQDGSTARHKDRVCNQPAFRVKIVDTVGAGDAFLGAAITLLAENTDLAEALRVGAAAGALAVSGAGAYASLPKREDIMQFLESPLAS
jgi:ribokinase